MKDNEKIKIKNENDSSFMKANIYTFEYDIIRNKTFSNKNIYFILIIVLLFIIIKLLVVIYNLKNDRNNCSKQQFNSNQSINFMDMALLKLKLLLV